MKTTRTRAAECGGRKLQSLVPGEYPCVRRLRHRRLLIFLWLQGYGSTFMAMLKQTNVYFCVIHLVRLVSQGQWTEALDYILPRFLPLEPRWTPSLEAMVLVKFLRVHRLFQSEVASRFSRDWRPMWARAAKIVQDLANTTPEFKGRLLLPDGLMGPQNVLPIGFGFASFRRRRHVKKCNRTTSNHAREKHSRRIANVYVDKMMSLPSSSHCSQELSLETIAKARDDWFRRIFEECIKAATRPGINQWCALQSGAREVSSVIGNSHPQIGDYPRPRPQTQPPAPNRQPSRMMTTTRAVVCGQEVQSFVPGEYPCVRRLRYRRLLNFLKLQGYGSTFVAMLKQTDAYFCVSHLARFVSQGHWTEALNYIFPHFLPVVPCSPPSLEASVLVKFLCVHRSFQKEVASKYSRDWRPMWAKAAKIVRDLANRTPEFKGRLLLPDGPMDPQNVLPIGFGFASFRRRRHVKKCTRPTSKLARKKHSRRVANIYVDKRMSLPSSSDCSQELSPEIMDKARDDWFGRIFEECFKGATCQVINQGRVLQSNAREGTPVTGNVINPGCSSVPLTTNAGPKESFISSVTGTGTDQEVCFAESARQGSRPRKRPMIEQMEDNSATKRQLTTGNNGQR